MYDQFSLLDVTDSQGNVTQFHLKEVNAKAEEVDINSSSTDLPSPDIGSSKTPEKVRQSEKITPKTGGFVSKFKTEKKTEESSEQVERRKKKKDSRKQDERKVLKETGVEENIKTTGKREVMRFQFVVKSFCSLSCMPFKM